MIMLLYYPPPNFMLQFKKKKWILWYTLHLAGSEGIKAKPVFTSRSIHVVCLFFSLSFGLGGSEEKIDVKNNITAEVVKCHQPCVQWNAFQRKKRNHHIKKKKNLG